MSQILIVYATDNGNTKTCAEAVAAGVTEAGGTPVIKAAQEATGDDVTAADALVIGSPTHMGSPDWRVKQFIDKQCSGLWMGDSAVGKVGAVFATGSGFGSAGGGVELSLLAMLSNLAELGMVIVPLPKNTPNYGDGGLQWGPYARVHNPDLSPSKASEDMLTVMRHHGANVTRVADAVAGKDLFAA